MTDSLPAFGTRSDFDPLRTAVVGIADDLTLPPYNPTLHHYNDEVRDALIASGGKPTSIKEVMPERYEGTAEQLDSLAALYERNGIEVLRPRPYSDEEKRYLEESQPGASLLYPADPVITIGKHYIELNIRRAYRRKEVFALRDLVQPLVDGDPEARHVAMPAAQPFAPSNGGPGPYLEGGDVIRYGSHLYVGESDIASNRAGTEWLARYMEPYGYQVHPVPMNGTVLHLLGIACLLREGLLMLYRPELVEDQLPGPLGEWQVIELTEQEARAFATVGVSLDDKRYVMPAGLNRIADQLDRHGVEPIQLPYDQVSFWGGSVCCSTQALSRAP
ncbi:MAG: amidinotransferase [Pseudomonadota bacterium]